MQSVLMADLMNTYVELDAKLQSEALPHEIYEASQDVSEQAREVSREKVALKAIEAELMLGVEGRNAEQRAANLEIEKKGHPGYCRQMQRLEDEERRLDDLTNYRDRLVQEFAATKYRANLLAALLVKLAGGSEIGSLPLREELSGADIGL